jgi:hypothetical protein
MGRNAAAVLASAISPRVCSNCVNVLYGNYGLACCEYSVDVSDYDAVECEAYEQAVRIKG